MFTVETMIHGYHEYQAVWDAPINESLAREREVGDIHNALVIAIKKDDEVVGHSARKISGL